MKRILLALVMVCSCLGMYAQEGPVKMTLNRKDTQIVAGTTTTEYEVVGYSTTPNCLVTENEWPKGHVGEGEPIVVEMPL